MPEAAEFVDFPTAARLAKTPAPTLRRWLLRRMIAIEHGLKGRGHYGKVGEVGLLSIFTGIALHRAGATEEVMKAAAAFFARSTREHLFHAISEGRSVLVIVGGRAMLCHPEGAVLNDSGQTQTAAIINLASVARQVCAAIEDARRMVEITRSN